MYRFLFFLAIIIIPAVFSWWLFIPLAIFSVYLIKLPYEIVFAGFILDSVYYFGDSALAKHPLVIFSIFLIAGAFFLSKIISWKKII
jgi:hypothetical protein